MKKLLFNALVLILAITSLISILGYFGQSNWKLDLFSHFKWQFFLILSTGTGIIFCLRKKFSIFFIPFVIINLIEVAPLYFGGNKDQSISETTKIICINLLSSNSQFKKVENYIKQKDPDIIILQEFNTLWQRMLEPNLNKYPFRLTIPRGDNFGIALYSKLKISELKELKIGDAGVPSIIGEIEFGTKKVGLIATHTLPPVDTWYFDKRNRQLSELSSLVSDMNSEVIIIGDLNTSSFSTHFKSLIANTELIDTRRGFGLLATWPTWFNLASTTLDHCLITKGIWVKSRGVGEDIGSDHLPIFIELGMK